MVFAGGSTFWSCGYKYTSPNYMAVISKSSDSGATWERHTLYSGSSYGYIRAIAVDPSDTDRVFGIGYKNSAYVLYSTVDGGANWTEMQATGYTGTPYDMMVHPTDPSRMAIASSSGLYATTDGGATWSKVTSSFTTVNSLYQSSVLGGLVSCTTTGIWIWENWSSTPVYFGEDPGISSVQRIIDTPEEYVIAGTSGASAWRAYCGTPVEETESSAVGSPFGLSVSPNPVSGGSATISFSLPSSGQADVIIYDLTGRSAGTVCSGNLNAGMHEIQMVTQDLAPGVYFARINGDNTSETGRFVISE